MGRYLNIGNVGFRKARNGEYVDKSALIGYVNRSLNTEHNMLCVTRARRFGKSMAAKMLNAYYDQSVDSLSLFQDLTIANDATFHEHLNQYPVIYLDVTSFTTQLNADIHQVVFMMNNALIDDLQHSYPDIQFGEQKSLLSCLLTIIEHTHQPFIMIIDEWDAICRESQNTPDVMRQYVDWLRNMFKTPDTDKVFAGVYMTGILPIIQYDTQSALNNFEELTMISPGALGGYFGFTEEEVDRLCDAYNMDVDTMRLWYDGYQIGDMRNMYNPYSVMTAIRKQSIENYWTTTGAYESLRKYITLNFDGLRDRVIELLAGNNVATNVLRFSNDIHSIQSCDDVLTTLAHLGYLSYDNQTKCCSIPNYEVRQEFERTIGDTNWTHLAITIQNSEQLLSDTLAGKNDAVAKAIELVHQDNTSILQYNDENSLACVLSIAYIAARKDYVMVRELPTGKGFADIVLIPRRNVQRPAMVLELKYNESAITAINQIKQKRYTGCLKDYVGEVLLVGVNYDKKDKIYSCIIEYSNESLPLINPSSTPHQPLINPSSNSPAQRLLDIMDNNTYSSDELMRRLGLKDRKSFQKTYLNPALQIGYIEMLYPDNPKRRGQRYKKR